MGVELEHRLFLAQSRAACSYHLSLFKGTDQYLFYGDYGWIFLTSDKLAESLSGRDP